jgi:aerobic-type carbon monoxide dehydrogenase small subunit (CoxS/CutS family)
MASPGVPASEAEGREGKNILTIEGLTAAKGTHILCTGFCRCWCDPMRLLPAGYGAFRLCHTAKKPASIPTEVRQAIKGNLCRAQVINRLEKLEMHARM